MKKLDQAGKTVLAKVPGSEPAIQNVSSGATIEELKMEDASQLLSHTNSPIDQAAATTNHPSGSSPCVDSHDRSAARSPESRECRECLSAAAHRLSQPMTALLGGIELGLMGKRSADDYRSVLEHLRDVAEQLGQLLNSLRNLGEAGVSSEVPGCVSLDSLSSQVLAELEDFAQSRDLRLQPSFEPGVCVRATRERLRETLQSLFGWIIQNSAGGGVIRIEIRKSQGEVHLSISPPRPDLQYLQIKTLEDITIPGVLFSQASKNGTLGWAINQRLVAALDGKLEIRTENTGPGCVRATFQLANPADESVHT